VPDVDTAFGKLGGYEIDQRWSDWSRDIIDSLVDKNGNVHRADEAGISTDQESAYPPISARSDAVQRGGAVDA